MKNSSDTIGNQTRDLATCSAVPQPTAPPRTPKMQRYTVYLYLETALHVSGGTPTHHQKRKQLYLQHLVFVTPLLLYAAIAEELELV